MMSMTQKEIDEEFEKAVKPEFERIYNQSDSPYTPEMFFMMCDEEEIAEFRNQWLMITLAIEEEGLIAPKLFEGMKVTECKD